MDSSAMRSQEEDERRTRREREGLIVAPMLQRIVVGRPEDNLSMLLDSDGGGWSRGLQFRELDLIIQSLSENDPNRHGTTPAAKRAVDGLPIVKITEEHLRSELSRCVVCMEEFDLDAETRQMPCKHLYHPDCILPWLRLHSSCPVCRLQLSDEYHNDTSGKKIQRSNSSASSSRRDYSSQGTQQVSNDYDSEVSFTSSSGVAPRGASSTSSVAPRRANPSVAPRGASSTSSVAPRRANPSVGPRGASSTSSVAPRRVNPSVAPTGASSTSSVAPRRVAPRRVAPRRANPSVAPRGTASRSGSRIYPWLRNLFHSHTN